MAGRHWPRAEIKDGKLLVEGERYPFVRGLKRHIWLEIGKLTHERHIEIDEGRTRRTDRLSAIAIVENDNLAIAGVKGSEEAVQELSFSIRPAPDEEKKFHWNVSFGVLAYAAEAAVEDEWYCEVYLPARVFNELVAAYKSGMVDGLRLACACEMWVRDGMERLPNLPAGAKVTWFLSPPPVDAPGSAPLERGLVTSFSWLEIIDSKSKQDEEPQQPASDRPRTVLKAILAVLIAILVALIGIAVFIAIN